MPIDFSLLEQALASLKSALEPPPANDRERDGAIQRFEYTFELAWKLSKRVLEENGIDSVSPKSVIRDLARLSWIVNAELWIEFLNARNKTSHIYKKEVADEVFGIAKKFLPACQSLLKRLKKEMS